MINDKVILEYIWLDAYGSLRSKNRVLQNFSIIEDNIPEWSFDGSSTGQANGDFSDIILKPFRAYKNPFIKYAESYLVMCGCYDNNYNPINSNTREECYIYSDNDKEGFLFGIEQEYVIYDKFISRPYSWNNLSYVCNDSIHYCSVGGDRAFGRQIVEEHLQLCLEAGLKIGGTNAEVMASQWEFQIGPCNPVEVSDQLWIARYILQRVAEKYSCYISFEPKPVGPDMPGSGAHTNFSTYKMRHENNIDNFYDACEKLKLTHKDCIAVYGKDNHLRLTGKNETNHIDNFSYGIGDRNASIRIPLHVANSKRGYLEDRRPAANMDPYLVTVAIMKSLLINNDSSNSSNSSSYASDESGYDSYS
jgi:glutamine synthetase